MSQRRNILQIVLSLIVIFSAIPAFSQNRTKEKMKVESFTYDRLDPTAMTKGTEQIDESNGRRCALIKIETTQRGFSFEVGGLFVKPFFQDASHPAEIWLYVSEGVNRLTISHPELGQITKYDLGQRVKSGQTYRLVLTTDEINTQRVDYSTTSDVDISVTPKDAELYINGMRQTLGADGSLRLPLAAGTHNYRASAPLYHPVQSRFEVKGSGDNRLDIRLRQAFGYLNVLTQKEFEGSEVFVDGVIVGSTPLDNVPTPSGRHQIEVRKPLYKTFGTEVNIADSATVTLTPRLADNYANVRIAVSSDKAAEIFIDGRPMGKGKWDGRLETGSHEITASRPSHRDANKMIEVELGKEQNVILDDPSPIYGNLSVKTSPEGADVIINGVKVGKTPYFSDKTLIGEQEMTLSYPGYREESRSFTLREGETATFNEKLTDFCSATVSTIPADATVSVNGGEPQATPYQLEVLAGDYRLGFEAPGYLTKTMTKRLDGSTPDFTVSLLRRYVYPKEIYVQAGYQYNGFSAFTAGVGGYLANVNLEANYLLGLNRSGTIYWNDNSGANTPFSATYSAMGFNVRAGYGFSLSNRYRVTPQAGIQYIYLRESTSSLLDGEFSSALDVYGGAADGANGMSVTIGVRASAVITRHFSVSVTPQYMVGVAKSNAFKAISAASGQLKSYSDGFGININLNAFF